MGVRRVAFTVIGVAQPQGSARAYVPFKWAKLAVRKGQSPRPLVVHDNPKVKHWRDQIAREAYPVVNGTPFSGAVVLTVTFTLPRPKRHANKCRHHVTRPDLDKLVRAVGDALSGVVFRDDGQIVDVRASKAYSDGIHPPSVAIVVEDAPMPEGALYD